MGQVQLSSGMLIPRVMRTANAWERMRGLLGRPALEKGEALWIEPCPSVHTIGMRYPIDVVFLNGENVVKKVVSGLRPFRFAACTGARSTVELAAGGAAELDIQPGSRLDWQEGV